jgi:hypothetical protein
MEKLTNLWGDFVDTLPYLLFSIGFICISLGIYARYKFRKNDTIR